MSIFGKEFTDRNIALPSGESLRCGTPLGWGLDSRSWLGRGDGRLGHGARRRSAGRSHGALPSHFRKLLRSDCFGHLELKVSVKTVIGGNRLGKRGRL